VADGRPSGLQASRIKKPPQKTEDWDLCRA
jgi:hypothetical protein